VLDFDEVLARGPPKPSSDEVSDEDEDDSERPVFSLATGKYRHAKRYGGERLSRAPFSIYLKDYPAEDNSTPAPISSSSSALMLRDQDDTVAVLKDSAAGNVLSAPFPHDSLD
jgi:diphthamide biosynthesis protein 2